MIRTKAPVYPQTPYKWNVDSARQCTWYAYYRAIEEGFTPPCWWDRATKTGSYTNAKLWLENYRDPWEVKGTYYKPVHGDIAVFDGNYGHVVFIEEVNGNTCLISDYNRVAKETFGTDTWECGTTLKGCGPLLGYLHYPHNSVPTVEANPQVNQILTTDSTLRVRLGPTLESEIYCFVQLGYYNVYSIVPATSADMAKCEGLKCWYEIDKGKYCANITVDFIPSQEQNLTNLQNQVRELTEENKRLIDILTQINNLSKIE